MNRIRLFVSLLLFCALLLGSSHVSAKGDSPSPLETVKTLLTTIRKIEDGKSLSEKQLTTNKKLSEEAVELLDVQLVSQKALGKYWGKRSEKEQSKFVTILSQLFEFVAFPNSAKFFNELELRFGDTIKSKNQATVPLTVIHKEEGEVEIDFELVQSSKHWRVVDVVLDGVSMRNNLKSQFYRVLKKKDYLDLVRRMIKKLEEAKG